VCDFIVQNYVSLDRASSWTMVAPPRSTELPIILGGLGLAALGAKVDDAAVRPGTGKSVGSK